jgi:hypothetical protein
MTESVVLILSTDALAGALLGAGVELAGYAPAFPRDNETARDALRRAKPGIVFVDCDHEEATSEAFIGPAMMTGASIAVYGSPRSTRDFRRIANAYRTECFALPIDHEDLIKLLAACSNARDT